MDKHIVSLLAAAIITVGAIAASGDSVVPSDVFGNNPFVQTAFTADPAPVVFKDSRYSDRLFVYTSNDAPNADWFDMSNLMCYSTTDMVNWTAHGAVMSDVDFTWAKAKTFWASQVIDRNGKFYAYVPIERNTGSGPQIGVGVSDSPYGPFKDALGKPLISGNWAGDIDPSVFIDDDGQAYLYWGNPKLKYAKLKSNMTEFDGSVVEVPMTEASFGKRSKVEEGRPTSYEEGPWFYKRNVSGLARPYYLVYAGGPISEHLAYATAPTATGPWTYGGIIMPNSNGLAFTNHPGVVDYKGKSYLFYHDNRLRALEGFTGGFTRSVSVAEFTYGSNGSIPQVSSSETGPAAIAALNPYNKTSATTINYSSKVKASRKNTADKNALEMIVNDIRNDGYIRIKAVDFGSVGATSFMANIACGSSNTKIEIRAGGTNSTNGRLLGTMNVANNGWNTWREQTVNLERITGIQDIYFVFKGSGGSELLRMEYWRFIGGGGDTANVRCDLNNLNASYVSGSNITRPNVSCGEGIAAGAASFYIGEAEITGWSSPGGTHQLYNTGVRNVVLNSLECGGTAINLNPAVSCGSFEVISDATTSIANGGTPIRAPFSVTARGKSLFITVSSPTVVEIYNIKGGKETSLNISSATRTVNLSLPNGIYFAKAHGTRNVKFVIKD